MIHHDTVFFEDSNHDWGWRNGQFYYYGHAMGLDEVGDIVAVLEEEDRPVMVMTVEPERRPLRRLKS